MKIFKANKKGEIKLLLVAVVLLPIFVLLIDGDTTAQFLLLLLSLIPLILVFWAYFYTYYKIDNENLFYRSGFLSGEVNILSITEIAKGKTMWSGIKPALAKNGLIIKYNKFDEIYIAPENSEDLICILTQINPRIIITSEVSD